MNLKTKYRPERWADWHDSRSASAANALSCGSVGFTEDFGAGKTTCAYLTTKGKFCDAPPEHRPCAQCARCLHVQKHWWRTGAGPIWMPGKQLSPNDWFQVFDCTTMVPTDVKRIREDLSGYGLAPRVFVFDELHRAQTPTQDMFLKLLDQDLPFLMIFCIATPNMKKIVRPLRQRIVPIEIAKPTPAQLRALLHRVAEGECIETLDSSATDFMIEECDSFRDLLTGLQIVLNEGRGLTMSSAQRAAAWIQLVRNTQEEDQ